MRHRSLLLLVAAALWLFSCGKDDSAPQGNFTLTFRATYDGQALERYKNYSYGARTVQINKFQTYLSDLVLLQSDGSEQRLSDIEFVEFTPDLSPDNKAVEVVRSYKVPAGAYAGFRLGYGVRPDLNAKRPSDFPAGNPLILENEYWLGWRSYIFTKVQGLYDLNNDVNPEATLTYHCGSDAAYRTAQFSKAISVGDTGALTVTFDVKKLFAEGTGLFDLEQAANRNTSHSADNTELGRRMMDNFPAATGL